MVLTVRVVLSSETAGSETVVSGAGVDGSGELTEAVFWHPAARRITAEHKIANAFFKLNIFILFSPLSYKINQQTDLLIMNKNSSRARFWLR
jgi:hypothetical protein